jgi:hypothetical protein
MHTRTVTVTLTLDFGDDADAAYASTAEELEMALLELLANNGGNDQLALFAEGLQAELTLTIDAAQESTQ